MLTSRFAPSPTGPLHLGHAYSAVLAHQAAHESGGQFLLRIEDLDQTRSRTEYVAAIEDDLRWLGLDWDGEPLVQSERSTVYAEALDRLRAHGFVYPCFCTRSDIAAALNAPHGRHAHYPGTCRGLADDPARRAAEPHSWRLDAAKAIEAVGVPGWTEFDGETLTAVAADVDDEILDAQQELAARLSRRGVAQRGAVGVAEMQQSGRRRREAARQHFTRS